ncbi:MAG TPA: hypothetical protein VIW24_05420 [Aldersonia sp.]
MTDAQPERRDRDENPRAGNGEPLIREAQDSAGNQQPKQRPDQLADERERTRKRNVEAAQQPATGRRHEHPTRRVLPRLQEQQVPGEHQQDIDRDVEHQVQQALSRRLHGDEHDRQEDCHRSRRAKSRSGSRHTPAPHPRVTFPTQNPTRHHPCRTTHHFHLPRIRGRDQKMRFPLPTPMKPQGRSPLNDIRG